MSPKLHRGFVLGILFPLLLAAYALGFLFYRSSSCWIDLDGRGYAFVTDTRYTERALYLAYYPALKLDGILTKRCYASVRFQR